MHRMRITAQQVSTMGHQGSARHALPTHGRRHAMACLTARCPHAALPPADANTPPAIYNIQVGLL